MSSFSRLSSLVLAGGTLTVVLSACATRADNNVDVPLSATLTERYVVGGVSDDVFYPRILFPGDIAAGQSGELYVLDAGSKQVLVFDSSGALRKRIARAGGAPGELQQPIAVGPRTDGGLSVVDYGKQTFVHFDNAGSPLAEVSMRGLGSVQRLVVTDDSAMVFGTNRRDTALLIRRNGGRNEMLAMMPPPTMNPVPAFDVCNVRGSERAPLLSPRMIYAGNANRVVFNVNGQYALSIWEKGKGVRLLKRTLAPDQLTVAEAVRLLGDSLSIVVGQERPCAVPTALVAQQAGIAQYAPAYTAILVGAGDLIWAIRSTAKNEARRADVYSASTGYLGTTMIGTANPVAILSDGALVSIETDDEDVPRVVVYDVAMSPAR